MSPIGFDLTQFGGGVPTPQRPTTPVQQPQPQQQPAPQPIIEDPNAPKDLNDALTRPLNSDLVNDDGTEYQDKLAKNAPGLKKQLWGIDKFAAQVIPVQIKDKEGKTIWIDRNGNNPLDPDTGEILTKAPKSTTE